MKPRRMAIPLCQLFVLLLNLCLSLHAWRWGNLFRSSSAAVARQTYINAINTRAFSAYRIITSVCSGRRPTGRWRRWRIIIRGSGWSRTWSLLCSLLLVVLRTYLRQHCLIKGSNPWVNETGSGVGVVVCSSTWSCGPRFGKILQYRGRKTPKICIKRCYMTQVCDTKQESFTKMYIPDNMPRNSDSRLFYFSRSALCFWGEHGSPETMFRGSQLA